MKFPIPRLKLSYMIKRKSNRAWSHYSYRSISWYWIMS